MFKYKSWRKNMATSDMHILVVGINEERMEEARSEAAEELGFSTDTENEEESSEIEARAISSAIEFHLGGDFVSNIYDHTCEPDGEQIADLSIFIKVGNKFVDITSIYDLSLEELSSMDYGSLGLYFVFNKEVELEDEYLISLSDECSEQVNRITYIFEEDGNFVYQAYSEGDYDTGFISHGNEEYYCSSSEKFPFLEYLVSKTIVTGK